MSKLFGIDLGTTNSAISVYVGNNTSRIIQLDGLQTTLPSCVMWMGGGNWIVGKEAYSNRFKENACYSIKKKMGSNYVHEFKYNGETVEKTPVEISALILKELVKRASYIYPDIKDVTITVPADFTSIQREATKQAGELAGLNVVAIINEPTAAALCYETSEDQDILVYDLGGGTFDVTALHVENFNQVATQTEDSGLNFGLLGINLEATSSKSASKMYEVIVSEGDRNLGGDDIDTEIFKEACRRYNQESKLKGKKEVLQEVLSHEEQEEIILRIEGYKKTLASSIGAKVEMNLSNGRTLIVSKEDVIHATKTIYNRTKLQVNRVLGNRKINRNAIKNIILVGGSTKSDILKELLMKDFPDCKISCELNPDEAVAVGASIQTAVAKGEASTSIMDVTPYTISVGVVTETATGALVDGKTLPILKKNTPLPVRVEQRFAVDNRNNNLEVNLYIGENILANECTHLGKVVLERSSQDEYATLVIIVDSNGVFKLKVVSGGCEKEVEITNILGASIEKKTVTPYTKLATRWKNQFKSQNIKMTKKLEKAFNDFEATGSESARDIIQTSMNKMKNTEITSEHTAIFSKFNPALDSADSTSTEEEQE